MSLNDDRRKPNLLRFLLLCNMVNQGTVSNHWKRVISTIGTKENSGKISVYNEFLEIARAFVFDMVSMTVKRLFRTLLFILERGYFLGFFEKQNEIWTVGKSAHSSQELSCAKVGLRWISLNLGLFRRLLYCSGL